MLRRPLKCSLVTSVALCAMLGGALAQNAGKPPAPSPGGSSAAAETTAVVKPLIKPEALEAPADVERAVRQVASELGKEVEFLAKRQSDIAACHEAAKVAPPGRSDSSYIVCLAEPAGATRASWTSVAKAFQTFDGELMKVNQRIGEVRQTVRDATRKREAEEAQLKASISSGLGKVRQLQAAMQKGATLTAAEEDAAWKLIDDIRTVKARAEIVARGRASAGQSLAALDGYAGQIAEARRSADRLIHQARNRSDFWGTVLEDLQGRAPIAVIAQGFNNADLGRLGPILNTLTGLSEIKLPGELAPEGAPEQTASILPRSSIADEIKRLLQTQ